MKKRQKRYYYAKGIHACSPHKKEYTYLCSEYIFNKLLTEFSNVTSIYAVVTTCNDDFVQNFDLVKITSIEIKKYFDINITSRAIRIFNQYELEEMEMKEESEV